MEKFSFTIFVIYVYLSLKKMPNFKRIMKKPLTFIFGQVNDSARKDLHYPSLLPGL